MGHVKKKCRLWKREQAKEKNDGKKNDKENIAAVVDGDMSIVYDDSSTNVTAHRDYFTSYVNGDYDNVWIGNEGASKIVGMRDICLEISVGCKLLLKDVRYVPNIRLNLIFIGNLDDDGYTN